MSKRIFYLSDYELQVLQVKNKTVIELQRFQKINNGEAEFAQYLKRNHKTPIYCLVEIQEEFQNLKIPHVLGPDHRNLIAHKKKLLFKNTSYTYSIVQGRETEGRRDDLVLFTALQNTKFLQPWLNLIISHKVPLVGIYSMSFLSERFLKYLPKAISTSTYTLLVAKTPPLNSQTLAGMRQNFFINKKLQFSRLIPLNASTPEEYANYIFEEIIKVQRYIEHNGSKFPQKKTDEPWSVVILTDTPLLNALNNYPKDKIFHLNLYILDNRDFVQHVGLQLVRRKVQGEKVQGEKVQGEKVQGEKKALERNALYLHHLAAFQLSSSWYTSNHYATAADTRYVLYRRLRIGIYFISIVLLSWTAMISFMTLEKAVALKEKGQKIADKIAKRQIELEHLAKKTPNLPFDILLIRNVVELGIRLKTHHISPRSAWEKVSYFMSSHPQVFLERLEWGIGHSKAEIFQPYSNALETEELDSAGDSESKKNPLKQFNPAKYFIEGIRLHGKIHPFHGNYQNALYTFNQFVKDLGQQGSDFWLVDILVSPYPSRILQGQISPQTNQVHKAPFVIDIFIKHSYPNEIY